MNTGTKLLWGFPSTIKISKIVSANSTNTAVFRPVSVEANEDIQDDSLRQTMLIHAEQQADMEEAAQERRHGREIDLDDGDWEGDALEYWLRGEYP